MKRKQVLLLLATMAVAGLSAGFGSQSIFADELPDEEVRDIDASTTDAETFEEAITDEIHAQQDVDEAQKAADTAKAVADEADDALNQAQQTADQAESDKEKAEKEAQDAVDHAVQNAQDALTTA